MWDRPPVKTRFKPKNGHFYLHCYIIYAHLAAVILESRNFQILLCVKDLNHL